MKKLIFIAVILFSFLSLETTNAQNPITTLEHTGTTTIFYGQNSLVDAYNASVSGDYLYLSTGYFNAPNSITKGVKIIGAGHFPDSVNIAKRTTIMSGLSINAGSDSLRLEGLFINGDITYATSSSINYVKVIRCRISNANFNSSSTSSSKNNCSFEECFINGSISFYHFGVNLLIKHCILTEVITFIDGGALIDGNIFMRSGYSPLQNVNSSAIRNNIFFNIESTGWPVLLSSNGNNVTNNLFVSPTVNFSANSNGNNYTGVAQSSIFLNQSGNSIDYTHDYHLKSPTSYLGTDGTQVGLYGGATPFKEKGLPSNPQILKKGIGTQTDNNGNLQINFNVKAQDN